MARHHDRKAAIAAALLAHHLDIPGVTPHEVAEAADRLGTLHKLHDTAAEVMGGDPGPIEFLSSRAEHEGRVPQPGVPAGPRNTPGYTPPSPPAPSSHSVAEHQGRVPQPGVPAGPRNGGTVRPPSTPGGPPITELLTPTPTRRRRPDISTAPTFAVKPKSSPATAVSGFADALGSIASDFTKGVENTTQQAARAAKTIPEKKINAVSGHKTLGTPTLAQLVSSSRQGKTRLNQKGRVTVPVTRQASHQLQAARQHYQQTAKPTYPGLSPEQAHVVQQVLTVGKEKGASRKEMLAAIETGLDESGLRNLGYGDASSQGWRQELTTEYGAKAHNVKASATDFFNETAQAGGGAGGSAGALAQAVQRPANPDPALYDQFKPQAAPILHNFLHGKPDPQAVAQLKLAKAKAAGLGIPTQAGDVERGPAPKTVFVRADAEGFVNWAKALLGTQEGSKLQLKWAGESGISAADPWCAAFIAAGIQRRGLTPPPGAANSQSWMTWNQGTNIGTDLNKAKPGDIIVIGAGDHIGLYTGGGNMIAGNWSDEVSEYPVSSDSRGIEGIIRPRFSGKKVAVQESAVLPGAAIGPSGELLPGPAGAGGEAAGGSGQQQVATSAPGGEVPVSPLLSVLNLAPGGTLAGNEEGESSLDALLRRRRV